MYAVEARDWSGFDFDEHAGISPGHRLRRSGISTSPMGTKAAPPRLSTSRQISGESADLEHYKTPSSPHRLSRSPRMSSRGAELDMSKSSNFSLPVRRSRIASPRLSSKEAPGFGAPHAPSLPLTPKGGRPRHSHVVRGEKAGDSRQHCEADLDLPGKATAALSMDLLPPVVRLPSAIKAIQTELMVVQREFSADICKVDLVDCDIFHWELALAGPERSPYQNGIFRFLLNFPPDYPEKLPRIRCATPVYHCNIDQSGNVCLGSFGKDGLSPQALTSPNMEKTEMVPPTCATKLRVTIISARGLRNADNMGLSDPFCTCHIPGKSWTKFQTAVIDNDLSPVWNEEHVINDYVLNDPKGDSLEFNVLDEDVGEAKGDSLGHATLKSSSFYPEGFDGDLNLIAAGKGHRATIHVKVSVLIPRQRHDRTTAIDIVEGLLSLLALPVLERPLVPSVAQLFKTDRRQHDRLAREWTLRHAL